MKTNKSTAKSLAKFKTHAFRARGIKCILLKKGLYETRGDIYGTDLLSVI